MISPQVVPTRVNESSKQPVFESVLISYSSKRAFIVAVVDCLFINYSSINEPKKKFQFSTK